MRKQLFLKEPAIFDSKLGRTRALLEDFAVVATNANIVLVQRNACSSSLHENIEAAVIASSMNLSSLDYAKKKYSKKSSRETNPERDPTPKDRYVQAYFLSKSYIRETIGRLKTLNTSPPSDAVFGASLVLERLPSSFFAAHLLYGLGHGYEGHAVSRLILEQIAWAVAAFTLAKSSNVDEIVTTKAIGELKKVVPEAGLLYGFLSKKAHIDYGSHSEFLEVRNGSNFVLYAHSNFDEYASVLLRLTDFFIIAWEYTQRDYLETLETINIASGRVILNEERPFLRRSMSYLSSSVGI